MTQAAAQLRAVRRWSGLILRLQRRGWGAPLVRRLRETPVLGAALRRAAGFRTAFDDLGAAAAAMGGAADQDTQANVDLHLQLTERPRLSDYPVLLHLSRIIEDGASVVDLGGNVGNLFYLYDRILSLPAGLRWTVHELPFIAARGAELAAQRGERRLQFSATAGGLAACDILLASGALHYFEKNLPALLEEAGARPRHLIFNRTPLSSVRRFCTVQDAGAYLAPATIHWRAGIDEGLRRLGYVEADRWEAPDMTLDTPLFPELRIPAYSGAYWRLGPGVSSVESATS